MVDLIPCSLRILLDGGESGKGYEYQTEEREWMILKILLRDKLHNVGSRYILYVHILLYSQDIPHFDAMRL